LFDGFVKRTASAYEKLMTLDVESVPAVANTVVLVCPDGMDATALVKVGVPVMMSDMDGSTGWKGTPGCKVIPERSVQNSPLGRAGT